MTSHFPSDFYSHWKLKLLGYFPLWASAHDISFLRILLLHFCVSTCPTNLNGKSFPPRNRCAHSFMLFLTRVAWVTLTWVILCDAIIWTRARSASSWSVFFTLPCSVDSSRMNEHSNDQSSDFDSCASVFPQKWQSFFPCKWSCAIDGQAEKDSILAPPLLPDPVARVHDVPESRGQEWPAARLWRPWPWYFSFTRYLWKGFLYSGHSSFLLSWGVKAPMISLDKLKSTEYPPPQSQSHLSANPLSRWPSSFRDSWFFSLPFTKWAGFLFPLKTIDIIEQL